MSNTRARVATVCQARIRFSTMEQNRSFVLELLEQALRHRPDIVCLPETFTQPAATYASIDEIAEPLDGPTVSAVAERARRAQCYILCPLFLRRAEGVFNSVVILDRSGACVGTYDKAQPVTTTADYTVRENGITPGGPPPVFDLDFGRIGIQVCFDAGFPEQWAALAAQDARLIFWPSAYNGGFPLQAYASLHGVYLVTASRGDKSRIIDPCGTVLQETDQIAPLLIRDINLDFAVCHYDFNYSIPDQLLATYPGQVEIRSHLDSGVFLVEPTDPSLTIARLQQELGFETAQQYFQRHRAMNGQPQEALHGQRPMYGKWWKLSQ